MNLRILLTTGAIVISMFALGAHAQTPGSLDQLDKNQQQRDRAQSASSSSETAPELYPGEASDVGPQSVLQLKPRRSWFEAQADVQFFYTDNMFNQDGGEIDTIVLLSTVQMAVAPTPFETPCGSLLAPRAGYRHQWINYGLDGETLPFSSFKLSEYDFNVSTIFSDLTWSRGNWRAQVGFDFMRLLDSSDYNEMYREYVPRWGVQRSIPICDKSSLVVGYEGDYRFTEREDFFLSDFNDRTDHSVYATYNYQLCPRAVVQPFYRFKYTRFIDNPFGEDEALLHSFGASLYLKVCQNFNVRFFAGYDIKCSNLSYLDYNRLDAGGGVNLNFRF